MMRLVRPAVMQLQDCRSLHGSCSSYTIHPWRANQLKWHQNEDLARRPPLVQSGLELCNCINDQSVALWYRLIAPYTLNDGAHV